ncbi:hypothetical protein NDU88_009581 [Pleurodeles waltl]|uniref:Uncharacterized protein n=1 Tax=Pleurodeles waltl TaxID=8319 RepID=A0AAV7RWZ6_PLEWA|nr:hypothetical protein NDU88_009581 [Pleurodeles waltl]
MAADLPCRRGPQYVERLSAADGGNMEFEIANLESYTVTWHNEFCQQKRLLTKGSSKKLEVELQKALGARAEAHQTHTDNQEEGSENEEELEQDPPEGLDMQPPEERGNILLGLEVHPRA